jgi:phosphate transport system permease protein
MAATAPAATRGMVRRGLGGRRADVRGLVFQGALLASLVVALLVLLALVVEMAQEGGGVLADRGLDFFTQGLSSNPDAAGVWQGLKGTLLLSLIVGVVAFPLGIAAAVYLEEYSRGSWATRLVAVNIRNLAGVPSIVYGLLGLAVFVDQARGITGGRSLMSGGLTLAVLVLPIVIITSQEALRAVPAGIREAAYGVGATRWETVRSHVLPYAAPGILTGTVLALARAAGEAAPLILVGASTGFFTSSGGGVLEEVRGPFTALPMVVFNWAKQSQVKFGPLAAAASLVLVALVVLVNGLAIALRNRYERRW